jgi:hypothetical protein
MCPEKKIEITDTDKFNFNEIRWWNYSFEDK